MCSLPTSLSFDFVKKGEHRLRAVLGSVIVHLGTWLMDYRPVLTSRLHSQPRPLGRMLLHRLPPPEQLWELLNILSSFSPLLPHNVCPLPHIPQHYWLNIGGLFITWNSESEAVCNRTRGNRVSLEPGKKESSYIHEPIFQTVANHHPIGPFSPTNIKKPGLKASKQ